jgi:zinc protease
VAHATLGSVTADAQTRNDAAPQVADLIRATMASLAASPPSPDELTARKQSLIGDYGRNIATAAGLGNVLGDLALYGIDLTEVKTYPDLVQAVTPAQVQAAAQGVLSPEGSSTIIVGDAKLFLSAVKAESPKVEVIPIAAFDPETPALRIAP